MYVKAVEAGGDGLGSLVATAASFIIIASTPYIPSHSIHCAMGHKRYNALTNNTIEILFKCGRSVPEIAKITHVSESAIYYKQRKLRAFGTVNPPSLFVQGRPRILLPMYYNTIIDFLNEYPLAYVDEINAFIWEEFDLRVNDMSI